MKCVGFDGRTYNIQASAYRVFNDDTKKRSSYHKRARIILKELFPCDLIFEEVTLPGSKSEFGTLFADFLIPAQRIIVEVHGEQHYTYNQFLHGDRQGFLNSKKRDRIKMDWCELNNITLIELPFGETDEQWRERFKQQDS